MDYANMNISAFADKLFSKEAVPGGGGTAALAGALGAALSGMVCNLTAGKKAYAAYEEDIQRILNEAQRLKEALLHMIDEDAENFLPLSKAYAMPKETDAEKILREKVMQDCLKQACEIPLKIVRTAYRAAMLNEELLNKSSKLAVSDVGCSAACIRTALTGGWLNAVINLSMIKDPAYVEHAEKTIKPLVEEGAGVCDAVYEKTLGILKGETTK